MLFLLFKSLAPAQTIQKAKATVMDGRTLLVSFI
jgi:hypothetical protein